MGRFFAVFIDFLIVFFVLMVLIALVFWIWKKTLGSKRFGRFAEWPREDVQQDNSKQSTEDKEKGSNEQQ